MELSDKGAVEIAAHEGIVPAPYRDSVGTMTFGIGHTAPAGPPDPSEMRGAMPGGPDLERAIDRAMEIFDDDIAKFERRVNDAISVPLKQHEFDALVSFDFNTGGIHRAKLTQAINRGDPDAAHHFMGWLKPPSLYERRRAEQRLFETGDYVTHDDRIPVWGTDGACTLTGVVRTISGDDMLERLRRMGRPAPKPEPDPWASLWALLRTFFGGRT